jgi:hypothetical protein
MKTMDNLTMGELVAQSATDDEVNLSDSSRGKANKGLLDFAGAVVLTSALGFGSKALFDSAEENYAGVGNLAEQRTLYANTGTAQGYLEQVRIPMAQGNKDFATGEALGLLALAVIGAYSAKRMKDMFSA